MRFLLSLCIAFFVSFSMCAATSPSGTQATKQGASQSMLAEHFKVINGLFHYLNGVLSNPKQTIDKNNLTVFFAPKATWILNDHVMATGINQIATYLLHQRYRMDMSIHLPLQAVYLTRSQWAVVKYQGEAKLKVGKALSLHAMVVVVFDSQGKIVKFDEVLAAL